MFNRFRNVEQNVVNNSRDEITDVESYIKDRINFVRNSTRQIREFNLIIERVKRDFAIERKYDEKNITRGDEPDQVDDEFDENLIDEESLDEDSIDQIKLMMINEQIDLNQPMTSKF